MINRHKYYLFIFVAAFNLSCGKGTAKNDQKENTSYSGSVDSLHHTIKYHDNVSKTKQGTYFIYSNERVNLILENCRRINKISHWSVINTEDLLETAEGGEARYYYKSGRLEKIATRNYGETFQKLTEYYLMSGKLCLVSEKLYEYDRPISYDATAIKQNNDTEAFDLEKSKISENRSYFEKDKLIKTDIDVATNSLDTEKEKILGDFKRLTGSIGR